MPSYTRQGKRTCLQCRDEQADQALKKSKCIHRIVTNSRVEIIGRCDGDVEHLLDVQISFLVQISETKLIKTRIRNKSHLPIYAVGS